LSQIIDRATALKIIVLSFENSCLNELAEIVSNIMQGEGVVVSDGLRESAEYRNGAKVAGKSKRRRRDGKHE
jgi:hypothetical protein